MQLGFKSLIGFDYIGFYLRQPPPLFNFLPRQSAWTADQTNLNLAALKNKRHQMSYITKYSILLQIQDQFLDSGWPEIQNQLRSDTPSDSKLLQIQFQDNLNLISPIFKIISNQDLSRIYDSFGCNISSCLSSELHHGLGLQN